MSGFQAHEPFGGADVSDAMPWHDGEGLQGVLACRIRGTGQLASAVFTTERVLVFDVVGRLRGIGGPENAAVMLEHRLLTVADAAAAGEPYAWPLALAVDTDEAWLMPTYLARITGRDLPWSISYPKRAAASWRVACLARRLGLVSTDLVETVDDGARLLVASGAAIRVSVAKRPAMPNALEPLVDDLRGVRLFANVCGYLDHTSALADEAGIALFRFDATGRVRAVNVHADALVAPAPAAAC